MAKTLIRIKAAGLYGEDGRPIEIGSEFTVSNLEESGLSPTLYEVVTGSRAKAAETGTKTEGGELPPKKFEKMSDEELVKLLADGNVTVPDGATRKDLLALAATIQK